MEFSWIFYKSSSVWFMECQFSDEVNLVFNSICFQSNNFFVNLNKTLAKQKLKKKTFARRNVMNF